MVKRKSHPFYFSAKLQSINDKTCRFILKDAFFFKQVGNHDEIFSGCILIVRFGSAQRTVNVWFTIICLNGIALKYAERNRSVQ